MEYRCPPRVCRIYVLIHMIFQTLTMYAVIINSTKNQLPTLVNDDLISLISHWVLFETAILK